MFSSNLEKLESQRLKAFSIFVKVKEDLTKSVEQALNIKQANSVKLMSLAETHNLISNEQASIDFHVEKVKKHIEQIDSIIQ